MPDLSFGMWVLVGMLAFSGLCALTAVALVWAGRDRDRVADDCWRDV